MFDSQVFKLDSVASHALSGQLAGFATPFGSFSFSHGDFANGYVALIIFAGDVGDEEENGLADGDATDQLLLDDLELRQRLLKLDALLAVVHGCFASTSRHADRDPSH